MRDSSSVAVVGRPLPHCPNGATTPKRPSCLDLVTLLREEMIEHAHLLAPFDLNITDQALTQAATI